MWNIEKIVSKGDYNYAVVIGHPNATRNKYVLHHRIVMENHIGRLLLSNEVVHHIDGNKQNNCADNLEWVTPKEHMSQRHVDVAGKHGRNRRWQTYNNPNRGAIAWLWGV